MSRKRSTDSRHSQPSPAQSSGKDYSSITITEWQANEEEPFSNYSLTSPSKMQRTTSGRQSLQPLSEVEVEVFDPEDWIDKSAPSVRAQQNHALPVLRQRSRRNSHRLSTSPSITQTPNNRLSLSQSPRTSASGILTNASTITTGMSRQSSRASGSICGGFEMMAIHSQVSDMSDFSIDETQSQLERKPPLSPIGDSASNIFGYTRSHVLDHTGGITHDSHAPTLAILPGTSTNSPARSITAEDMEMKRISSAESNVSSKSRASRRREEQLVQGERPIAPKLSDEEVTMSRQSSASGHGMIRIRSADGSSKDVIPIEKTPYNRPQREKVKCDQCNDYSDGFRGEHELRRHMDRAHSTSRKIWICIDCSPDKSKLAGCKACRTGKTYNAYYNAAAHLRRVHFNPKPKGRKTKGDSERGRGGIGGGDQPPMEELKKWMEEREEPVHDSGPTGTFGTVKQFRRDAECNDVSRCGQNDNRNKAGSLVTSDFNNAAGLVALSERIASVPTTRTFYDNGPTQNLDQTLLTSNNDLSALFLDSAMPFEFELPFDDPQTFSGFDDSLPQFDDM